MAFSPFASAAAFIPVVALVACVGSLPANAQVPAAAAAGPACALQPRYPLSTHQAELQALSQQLEAISATPGCLADAYFHAWRGAVLMALGRPEQAMEPLERALLTQPNLPAAQLDLAQALAQQGDTASASGLLEALQQRDDLPPAVRAAVAQQRVALAAPVPAAPRWYSRWQLSALAGADSNLNNAPAATELTLTFPQGNVTLPLAPASLPQSGAAGLTLLQWQGLRPAGAALWVLQADLRARHTQESATRYLQTDLAATWLQAPEAPEQWVARVGGTHLQFGGRKLLEGLRTSLQYQWGKLGAGAATLPALLADCRPSAGLEAEERRFPVSPELGGRYTGATAGLVCTPGQAVPEGSVGRPGAPVIYSLQAKAGRDAPMDEARPGGAQRRSEIRAQWEGPLPSPWPGVLAPGRLGLQYAATRQADRSGYSVLLDNNAIRRTTRYALLIEASWPLGGGLSALVNAEASAQRSNLAAFTARQRALYLGLRWELM